MGLPICVVWKRTWRPAGCQVPRFLLSPWTWGWCVLSRGVVEGAVGFVHLGRWMPAGQRFPLSATAPFVWTVR